MPAMSASISTAQLYQPFSIVPTILRSFDYEEARRADWDACFRFMSLDKEDVQRFYSVYRQIDANNSGDLDYGEFVRYFALDDSAPFIGRCFKMMDQDHSGEVNFLEAGTHAPLEPAYLR